MRNAAMVLLLIFLFTATGCVAAPGVGGPGGGYEVITPDHRIPISESGAGAGKWDGNDLSIEYRYTADPGGVAISGVLDFIDSIKYNYGLLNYFNAGIIFGDAEGRIVGSTTLITTRQSGIDGYSGIRFSQRIPLPYGAAVFAFTYNGEIMEVRSGRKRGGGGNPTSIWNYPVTKLRGSQKAPQ